MPTSQGFFNLVCVADAKSVGCSMRIRNSDGPTHSNPNTDRWFSYSIFAHRCISKFTAQSRRSDLMREGLSPVTDERT